MLERKVLITLLLCSFLILHHTHEATDQGFVRISETHFVKDDHPFYFSGFNAYWFMLMASNPLWRGNVTTAFQEANKYGMTVARTWAFSDGAPNPLQYSPGSYNEDMFKGLDFVISEAGKYGINLILSLVNSNPEFGGRKQYVQWAKDSGEKTTSDDDFYTNTVVKGYYKNHIKTVVTRKNSITGIAYKDDPTILAWELINEPRCQIDTSGKTVQEWIKEMGVHAKSIDSNHLLEIGLEGFYGEAKKQVNPHGYLLGTDFISNNQIAEIDFTTIHAYPDLWLPGTDHRAQLEYVRMWLKAHIEDSKSVLKKPLVFTEFGKSSRALGYNITLRDDYFGSIFEDIYSSAKSGGPCIGGLFWQVLDPGMNNLRDGYEVVLPESPTTATIIAEQSHKLSMLNQ